MNTRLPALLFLCALAAACSIQGPQESEQTQESRDDIVGGNPTASLPAVGAITRFGGTHCTGTLISSRRVVTAAHCLEGVSAGSLKFAIGPNAFQPEAVIDVVSITPHPNYNSAQLTNDIGYLDLAQNAPVAPMPLLSSMDNSWVGRSLIFVGYGASNGFSQTGSGTKRFVEMAIAQVGATTFSYADVNKNTCNGDSGGPAFAQVGDELFVAGVTSYGDQNCVQFGVDTRTDAFSDFLGVNSQPTDPCGGETFEGRCDGNDVVWCENDSVNTQSCGGDQVCGFSTEKNYFACNDKPQDPCQGETFEGRCENNKVIYCEAEEVKTIDCPNTCGFVANQGFFNCL